MDLQIIQIIITRRGLQSKREGGNNLTSKAFSLESRKGKERLGRGGKPCSWLFSSAVKDLNLVYRTICGVTVKQIQRVARARVLLGKSGFHVQRSNYLVKLLLIIAHMLWFNFILGLNAIFFSFKLIILHYHTPPPPPPKKKTQKKIKFKPRIKLNHNT